MLKIVNGRPFWLNVLLVILLGFLSLLGALKMLGVITKHNKVLTVPNVLHANTIASIQLLEDKGFDVVIQDSTYTDTAKLGTILKQFPEGNSTIKVNRTVLLTVNRAVLPMIEFPSLIGKSQEYALEILERSHFKLGDTTFEPSFMKGAVTQQNLNGKKLEAGTKIPWGSKIELVIGSGLSNRQFQVPSLLGLTYTQAKALLIEKRLILASVNADADVSDSANAFVYKQYPPRENGDRTLNYIREGQIMDIELSKVMKYIALDSTAGNISVIDDVDIAQMEKDNAEAMKLNAAKEKLEGTDKSKTAGKRIRPKKPFIPKPPKAPSIITSPPKTTPKPTASKPKK